MSPLLVTSLMVAIVCLVAMGAYLIAIQTDGENSVSGREDLNATKLPDLPPCARAAGPRRRKRIVNGSKTSPEQFPWVVMVLVEGRFQCGGSIIDHQHVLTAAHCVKKARVPPHYNSTKTEVIAGKHTYDISGKYDDIMEQRVTVADVIPHPNYADRKRIAKREVDQLATTFSPSYLTISPGVKGLVADHDLAILKLESSLTWTSRVSPICLPKARDYVLPGKGTVVGWGSVDARNRVNWVPKAPAVLQQLTVRVRLKQDCVRQLSYPYTRFMTNHQICAVSVRPGVSSTCNGDSGGPLFARNEDDGFHVQFGVLSWGFCAKRPSIPSFFTYLPSYVSWINMAIGRLDR